MLFHVTITHTEGDCPGRRSHTLPELASPGGRVEALAAEWSVKQHSVVWGAPCILWGEPEHVAYALLEASGLEAIERFLGTSVPDGWMTRVVPVFALPGQLAAVREVLALPAIAVEAPTREAVEEAEASDVADVDTLKGVSISGDDEPPAAAVEEPPDQRVTRAIPQPTPPPPPVAAAEQIPGPDPASVTRFIDRRAILEASGTPPPDADQLAVVSGLSSGDEPPSPSDSSTVILEPKEHRPTGLRLVASSGPAQGAVFHVGEDGATLGRLPENSICLTDGRLSRQHARIDFRDDAFWLSDLGSQNGTLVNDRPVSETYRLQVGDSIELGTTRLTVMLESDD